MSSKHLGAGSTFPDRVPGLSRIISMEFCPFAQRARLVAVAKELPHDIVNVNLKNKPEWLFEYHKEGKVPVLLHELNTVTESTDVCDFLEANISGPKLTHDDPELKKADLELRNQGDTFTSALVGAMFGSSLKTDGLETVEENLNALLIPYEEALKSRGTKYFNGDSHPGLVDLIIWPWFERMPVIYILEGSTAFKGFCIPPLSDNLPLLQQWLVDMTESEAVLKTRNPIEKHLKLNQYTKSGEVFDYDEI